MAVENDKIPTINAEEAKISNIDDIIVYPKYIVENVQYNDIVKCALMNVDEIVVDVNENVIDNITGSSKSTIEDKSNTQFDDDPFCCSS